MRRWIKRIALSLLAVLAIVLVVVGVVAWRATRVPAWYEAAVDQTPPDELADATINGPLTKLQNWYSQAATGDVDAKPDADKVYTLELTEAQINALLARCFDLLHGQYQTFRVRLLPGQVTTAFIWAAQGRAVSVSTTIAPAADGSPTVSLGGISLGNQGVPLNLLTGAPMRQARVAVEQLRQGKKTPRIDEHDLASTFTVETYYGRRLLDALAGRAVSPEAFLPRGADQDWVATRVTHLDVSAGRVAITFRLLSAEERTTIAAELAGPLPGT